MASFLTVKVHPVVYMTMVDSYERRQQKSGMSDKALGTLLGFYEKNIVQVRQCKLKIGLIGYQLFCYPVSRDGRTAGNKRYL